MDIQDQALVAVDDALLRDMMESHVRGVFSNIEDPELSGPLLALLDALVASTHRDTDSAGMLARNVLGYAAKSAFEVLLAFKGV